MSYIQSLIRVLLDNKLNFLQILIAILGCAIIFFILDKLILKSKNSTVLCFLPWQLAFSTLGCLFVYNKLSKTFEITTKQILGVGALIVIAIITVFVLICSILLLNIKLIKRISNYRKLKAKKNKNITFTSEEFGVIESFTRTWLSQHLEKFNNDRIKMLKATSDEYIQELAKELKFISKNAKNSAQNSFVYYINRWSSK